MVSSQEFFYAIDVQAFYEEKIPGTGNWIISKPE
jgi:hypothetical protein